MPLNKCLHYDDTKHCISECHAGIGMQYYLWGVFRRVKTKEIVIKEESLNIPSSVPSLEHPGYGHSTHSNKDNNEDVDMEIDMVGGKDVGRIDVAVGKAKKGQSENCDSFPGSTVKVVNSFAPAEPWGRPHTYLDAPPGFEEVCRLKLSGGNSSKPTFKENPVLNDVKATVKKENTSIENFSAGVMGSHGLSFQAASWRQLKVN